MLSDENNNVQKHVTGNFTHDINKTSQTSACNQLQNLKRSVNIK